MQRDELVVTREDQAIALQDVGFLSHFLTPASPSDVARKLGMAANLAHHHARRHAELGILEEVKREAGKVYVQLVARMFKHARTLIPVEDPNYGVNATLSLLQRHFSAAYERSDRLVENQDPDWTVYGFTADQHRPQDERDIRGEPLEARPAHFQARVLRLSPARYRSFVNQVWRLLEDLEPDRDDAESGCTFAFLAMDGVLQPGQQDSKVISSFVPPKA
jgi:hypothetical protein